MRWQRPRGSRQAAAGRRQQADDSRQAAAGRRQQTDDGEVGDGDDDDVDGHRYLYPFCCQTVSADDNFDLTLCPCILR